MRFPLPILLVAACSTPTTTFDAGSDPATPRRGSDPVAVAREMLDRSDLVLTSRHRSLLGDHVRFGKLASDGTPIVEAEVAVHLTGAAPLWSRAQVVDEHPAPQRLVGARRIDAATAMLRARAAIPAGGTIDRSTVAAVALPGADRDDVRAGFRVMVHTLRPAHGWEVWVDGDGNAEVRRDRYVHVDGTGLAYDPNPVMQTGDILLVDGNDITTTALDAARIAVTLPRLDGSGVLRGQFADAHGLSEPARATSATNAFAFDRTDDHFEEVSAYYHLDAAQARLQALGFTDANNRVQVAIVNAFTDDNSFYDPSDRIIRFGDGGVDDAEDGDIVVHEYGHSVQDNIVPGYGTTQEASSIGEGWGDLLAGSVEPIDAAGHVPAINRACIGAWDATSYDTHMPPCLRRLDGTKHFPESADGEVHDDGEIWSAAAWAIYAALGDPAMGLQLVVESFYTVTPGVTFQEWSDSILAVDTAMHAGAHVEAITKILWDRGLHRTPHAPGAFVGSTMTKLAELGPAAPLANSADDTLTIHEAGAAAIRVHFSAVDMEVDPQCFAGHCDNVYIFDGQGNLYGILGGALGATDAPIVPGDTVIVRWVTDGSVASQGFHIDHYDIEGGTPPMPDAGVDIDAGDDAAATGDGGGCCDAGSSSVPATGALTLVVFAHLVGRRRRIRT